MVVLGEAAPQPTGLHANERIGLSIEIGWTAEDLDPDRVTLQAFGATRERLFDDEPQEVPRATGAREERACEHALELRSDLGNRRLRRGCGAIRLASCHRSAAAWCWIIERYAVFTCRG